MLITLLTWNKKTKILGNSFMVTDPFALEKNAFESLHCASRNGFFGTSQSYPGAIRMIYCGRGATNYCRVRLVSTRTDAVGASNFIPSFPWALVLTRVTGHETMSLYLSCLTARHCTNKTNFSSRKCFLLS